jgi:hypothetical protein
MSAVFVRRAKQVGFTEDQAELLDIELHNSDILATKRDLKELETLLKHDIEKLEINLRRDIELLRSDTGKQIAECKADLIRWIIGVVLGAGFVQTGVIIGVLLKVAHLV